MRCSNCGVELPPLRDFCPNCGTPTAWGLRRQGSGHPGGRSPEELKRNRKAVLIVCAALAGVLLVSGRLTPHIPFLHIPVHINMNEPRKGPAVTNAVELAQAYSADPEAAAKRFGGREIQVSGEFLRIVPDGYGSIDMRLKTSNPDFPLGVDLADESVDDAKLLRPGQQVTVSCRRVAGSGNDRWLQNCAIQPGGGADAAAPPASLAPPPPPSPPPPVAPAPQKTR